MHVSSSEIIAARIRTLVDIQSASSSLYRLNMYLATWRSLPDTWLLGADTLQLGPFLARYSLVRYPHYYAPGFATDSDVIYLVLLGGVPLLLAFVWLALYIAKRMWTAPRIGDAPLMAAIACTAAMQMLFDNSLSSALGWFLLGLLSCPHSRSRRVTMRVAATV